jgi:hypothetical protein
MIRLKTNIGKYYYEEAKRAFSEGVAYEVLDVFEIEHYYSIEPTADVIILKEDIFEDDRYLPPCILVHDLEYYKIEFI